MDDYIVCIISVYAYNLLCLHLRPFRILVLLHMNLKPKLQFFSKTNWNQTDYEESRTITTLKTCVIDHSVAE